MISHGGWWNAGTPLHLEGQCLCLPLSIHTLQAVAAGLAAVLSLGLMVPAWPGGGGKSGGGRGRNTMPPAWNPDWEARYSFRNWTSDLLVWSILATDLEPAQQNAAIITQLGGAARDLVRSLTYEEITQGGTLNGQHQDPVTYLLSSGKRTA